MFGIDGVRNSTSIKQWNKAICYFEIKRVLEMLTKNIKYPYVKFGFDVVGVLASIGIFFIFVLIHILTSL